MGNIPLSVMIFRRTFVLLFVIVLLLAIFYLVVIGYLSILLGIIANLLTGLVILGALTLLHLRGRKEILEFYGLTNEKQTLRVYVSNIRVRPQGTQPIDPNEYIEKGYFGSALLRIEHLGVDGICEDLRASVVPLIPYTLPDWLRSRHLGLATVELHEDVSPTEMDEVSCEDNLLLVGSSVYNIATEHYMKHENCEFDFTYTQKPDPTNPKNTIKERTFSVKGKDIPLPGREVGRELAIIQRLTDREHENTVVICAGLSAVATYGSLLYLRQHWAELYNEFGKNDFGICIAFPGQDRNSEKPVEPVRIYPPLSHVARRRRMNRLVNFWNG